MTHFKDLAQILSEYRSSNDLTLRELGDKVRLSYSYLGKIERRETIPPKITVYHIARDLDMSPYQLMLSAGYIVVLGKDISVRDLELDYDRLKAVTDDYRIYALRDAIPRHLKIRGFGSMRTAEELKLDYRYFQDVMNCLETVTLEIATDICILLDVNFYTIFRIEKLFADFIVPMNDEDVAYQIHKYILGKRQQEHTEQYLISDNPIVHKEALTLLKDIDTIDEIVFLKEQLNLYKRLNLKPRKTELKL